MACALRSAAPLPLLIASSCSLLTNLESLRSGDASAPDAGDASELFRETFDEPDGAYSSALTRKATGTDMTIATDDAVSKPASLRIANTTLDGGASEGHLDVLMGPAPFPSTIRCEASARVEGFADGTSQLFVLFLIPADQHVYDVYLAATPTALELHEFDGKSSLDTNVPAAKLLYDGLWHTVALTVQLNGTPSVTLDSNTVALKNLAIPPGVFGAHFRIGISVANSASAWTAHFDNVVCTAP
jgi:hypothetical protein